MKRLSIATLAFLFAAAFAVAGGQGEATATAADGPTEISIMTLFYAPEPATPDNVLEEEIEARTNTELEVQWVSPNNYDDKLNVTLASGDMPDLTLVRKFPMPELVVSMMSQGAFWEIGPYIERYENLQAMPESIWRNITFVDGKIYSFPRPRPLYGGETSILRKDWLDSLGMDMPASIDEVTEVLRAFVFDDPDGNGKDDTLGLVADVRAADMGALNFFEYVFNNTTGHWKAVDGKLVPSFSLDSQRDALVWMKELYDEGLLVEDFAVLQKGEVSNLLKTGDAGMSCNALNATVGWTHNLQKVNPNGRFAGLPPVENSYGEVYANESQGFWGYYVVPKQSVDAEEFEAICAFLDFAYSEEGHNLGKYGLEGVHHNVVDGEIEMIPDSFDETNSPSYNQILRMYERYGRAYGSTVTPEHYEENKSLVDAYEQHAVGNPAIGIVSETEQESTVDYWGDVVEAKVKTIMGIMSLSEWDAFVDDLMSSDEFSTIVEEYNAQYRP